MSAGTSRVVNTEQDGDFVMAVPGIEHTRRPSDILALINIPYSIYYVFILTEELHYSNIKLYIKYQFHTERIDVF